MPPCCILLLCRNDFLTLHLNRSFHMVERDFREGGNLVSNGCFVHLLCPVDQGVSIFTTCGVELVPKDQANAGAGITVFWADLDMAQFFQTNLAILVDRVFPLWRSHDGCDMESQGFLFSTQSLTKYLFQHFLCNGRIHRFSFS